MFPLVVWIMQLWKLSVVVFITSTHADNEIETNGSAHYTGADWTRQSLCTGNNMSMIYKLTNLPTNPQEKV